VRLPGGAITALGITQLIGWGTTFYLPAVLAQSMAADTGWSTTEIFAAFSLSLLVAGAVSGRIGRMLDRHGARAVMAVGSGGVVLGLLTLASASHWLQLYLAWVVLGVASRATQYDAAFAAIAAITGSGARRAISLVTLWGGLASTVFWPIGHTLGETIGWRWTLALYALLNLAVCLPLHLRFAAAGRAAGAATVSPALVPAAAPGIEPPGTAEDAARDALAGRERDRALLTFAIVLAAYSFVFSCLAAHLIGVIQGLGLAATTAVGLSSMMGVAQVASRSLELIGQRWLAPLTVGVISLGLLPLSLSIMLAARGDPLLIAGAALLCGAGNGLVTVVRGAVPLALFGHVGYASTLGRIAAPGLASAALAPLIFDRVLQAVGARGGLVLLTVVGLAAFTGMLWLSRQRPAGSRR
jgi:MFS family permease